MAPVGRDAFLAELRALPTDRRAAFLAALYEARGRRVERDGTRLRIGPPDDLTVLVPGDQRDGAVEDPDDEREGVDAILALDADSEATPGGSAAGTEGEDPAPGVVDRIDGAEVYHAALYAIDRTTLERLVERFFGRALTSFVDADARPDRDAGIPADGADAEPDAAGPRTPTGTWSAGSVGSAAAATRGWTDTAGRAGSGRDPADEGDDTDERIARPRLRAAAAVAVVAVLALALAGSGAVPGTLPATDSAGGGASTGTLTPLTPEESTAREGTAVVFDDVERTPGQGDTVFDVGRGAGTETATTGPTSRAPGVESAALPPGISPSGEIDEAALAEAHRRALANRSFRLTLVYREFADGRPVGVRREVLRVEHATRYRVDTRETGEFRTTPVSLGGGDVYANGSTVTHREGRDRSGPLPRGDEVEPGSDGAVPYGDSTAQYLRWYLSVEESTIAGRATVDGQAAYWLTIDGDPWVGSANVTGSVLVTRDGTVRELRRSYDDPDHPGTSLVFTLRVSDVGSTTVRPPAWYERPDPAGTGEDGTSGNGTGEDETSGDGTDRSGTSGTETDGTDEGESGAGANATGTATPTETAAPTPTETGDAGEDRRDDG